MTETRKRIALLEHAEKLADDAGLAKPEGLLWALKSVRRDMRTFNAYRWPWPGSWVEAHDVNESNTTNPCPSRPGDGLCVGLTWAGMASGGISAHTLLLIGYRETDVLASNADKLRARAVYVRDVVDGVRLVRQHGAGADLSVAYLSGADLSVADLSGAAMDARTRWPSGFKPVERGVRA